MARERTQWRVRCIEDGSRHYITQQTGTQPPTTCPDDPAHSVIVTVHAYVDAEYDPTAALDDGHVLVSVTGSGASARPFRPLTSPCGWLANACGQLLVEGQ